MHKPVVHIWFDWSQAQSRDHWRSSTSPLVHSRCAALSMMPHKKSEDFRDVDNAFLTPLSFFWQVKTLEMLLRKNNIILQFSFLHQPPSATIANTTVIYHFFPPIGLLQCPEPEHIQQSSQFGAMIVWM